MAKARLPQRPLHGPRLAEAEQIGGARRRVERVMAFEGAADDPQGVDLALRAPDGDRDAPARDPHAVHFTERALGVPHYHEPEPTDHSVKCQIRERAALCVPLAAQYA